MSTDEDWTTSPCCPCQGQTAWEVLLGQPACQPTNLACSPLFLCYLVITAPWDKALQADMYQNRVSSWWGGFLIHHHHPPAISPFVVLLPQLQTLSSPVFTVGCADSKTDDFTGLREALQSSGLLEDISLAPPFPLSGN